MTVPQLRNDPPAPATLPQPPTPFVGRRNELDEIAQTVNQPHCRLLTLVAPGGMGKTRLAIAAAGELSDAFDQGVAFVDLQSVTDAALLTAAVCNALGLTPSPQETPEEQLLRYLGEREMLLILDNFENVLAGAEQLTPLLQQTGVKLLITSREPIRLHEEWLFPLGGLGFPRDRSFDFSSANGDDPAGLLAEFPALQLFAQHARRTYPRFDFAQEHADVVRISRLTEGMPLALELAAAWRRILSCAEIAQEIERSLDILETQLRDLPSRHRSLRVICEQVWRQLDPRAQMAFSRLAVFRGPFTREAAQEVTGATLVDLSALVDSSLLRWSTDADQTYRLHELMHRFAGEKLAAAPADIHASRARHSAYYLTRLALHPQQLDDALPVELAVTAREIENVRAAWLWAVEQQKFAAVDDALTALHRFYRIRGRSREGHALMLQTLAGLDAAAADAYGGEMPRRQLLRGRLHVSLGIFEYVQGNYRRAALELEQGLAIARTLHHARAEMSALSALGTIAVWQGNYDRGRALLRHSLDIARREQRPLDEADAVCSLARSYALAGEYVDAKRLARQSLTILRRQGGNNILAHTLDILGWATFCLGQYDESAAAYGESLAVFEELGNPLGRVLALGGVGSVAWARGGESLHEAANLMARSVAICRESDQRQHLATHLWWSAQVALDLEQYAQARALSREGLTLAETLDSLVLRAFNATALGAASCATGDWLSSWSLLDQAARAALQAATLPPLALASFYMAELLSRSPRHAAQTVELLQAVIDHPATWQPVRLRAATLQKRVGITPKRGVVRPLEETVNRLLATLPDFAAWTDARPHAAQASLVEPLTEREQEVLALVANGLTNKDIAEQLVMTVGTVKWYTNAIYGKLAVKNRTQAVAYAREIGLLPA